MRILFLAPQPFFRVRGTPINVRNVVTALAAAGHEVDLLCYPFGEEVSMPGVRLLRSPRIPGIRDVAVGPSLAKIPLDLAMALRACGLVWGHRYDVIHAVEESVFFATWLRRLARGRPRLIYDMDSCISDQLAYSGKLSNKWALRRVEGMERRAIRQSAFVLTVCEALSDTVRNLVPEAKIVQIEDAPLDPAFVPDETGAAALREEIAAEGPFAVYTGNFESYQGVDLLVEAASHLRQACTLVLVGGQAAQVEALRAQAAASGVADRVVFTGPLPLERMAACATMATLLLSPRREGNNTALKIYTYMQSGRAIIAIDMPTHTQVLDDTCAYLVRPEAKAIAAGIDAALADPAGAVARGRAAAAKIEAQYSLPQFERKVQAAYAELGED